MRRCRPSDYAGRTFDVLLSRLSALTRGQSGQQSAVSYQQSASAISHQPSVLSPQSPVPVPIPSPQSRIPNPQSRALAPVTQSAILPSASSDRRGVVGLLVLLFAITYLDRVCISVAGPRMQEDLGHRSDRVGMGDGHVHARLLLFEIPTGMLADRIGPRRVLTRIVVWWSAFTALTGAMTGFYPLLLTQVPVRRRRSGRVSECVGGGVAMVPASPTRHDLRRDPDGQPGRRRNRAVAGAADPDALRLADVVLRLRGGRAGLGGGWHAWFRDSPEEKRGREPRRTDPPPPSPRLSPPSHAFPWRLASRSSTVWSMLGLAFCYVYVYNFFQTWFHTFLVRGRGFSEATLLLSALPVRRRRVRQPCRRRRERRAGAAARCEARPASHRRHGPDGGGGVHRCGDAHAPSAADRGLPRRSPTERSPSSSPGCSASAWTSAGRAPERWWA